MLRGGAGKILLYRGGSEPLGGARKSGGAGTPLETMVLHLFCPKIIDRLTKLLQ